MKHLFFAMAGFLFSVTTLANPVSVWNCGDAVNVEFKSESAPGTVTDKQGNTLGQLEEENSFDSENGYLTFKGQIYECSYQGDK